MKKFALSQQALIGIAPAAGCRPRPAEPSWAKHLLERGFELYERKLPEGGGVAPGLFYPLKVEAAVEQAGALRGLADGRQRRPRGRSPGSRRATDPSRRRCTRSTRRSAGLAVTTPRYNTAITAVTNGAYPYGGIDLARLYDGRQEVAATLGARVPSAFGIVARNRNGRIRLATARPAAEARRPAAAAAAGARAASAARARRCARSRDRSTSCA